MGGRDARRVSRPPDTGENNSGQRISSNSTAETIYALPGNEALDRERRVLSTSGHVTIAQLGAATAFDAANEQVKRARACHYYRVGVNDWKGRREQVLYIGGGLREMIPRKDRWCGGVYGGARCTRVWWRTLVRQGWTSR